MIISGIAGAGDGLRHAHRAGGSSSLITINGQNGNDFFKGVLVQMNAQQQAQLQANSLTNPGDSPTQRPDREATAGGSGGFRPPRRVSAPAASQAAAAAPADAPTPLKLDDIKNMVAAGIKPDAIIDAIKESKATYSQQDVTAAQQVTPALDPTIIAFMKNPAA